jgi:hypothetical protein
VEGDNDIQESQEEQEEEEAQVVVVDGERQADGRDRVVVHGRLPNAG